MSNAIKLSREKKEEMLVEIKNFFLHEREENIGDLAASQVLDFITERLGPEFYNQGVYDSHKYMNDSIEDLLGIQIYRKSGR